MKNGIILLLLLIALPCTAQENREVQQKDKLQSGKVSLVILGTIQDGGSPHIGCRKECCKKLFLHPDKSRKVVALGLIDFENRKKFLMEATPDFTQQCRLLNNKTSFDTSDLPDGIFLTHAHIGHYTGLMYLGKEAINAIGVPVFAMPRMTSFLEQNGPWSQLVRLKNIVINGITAEEELAPTSLLKIIPFSVPHRDEYSETVGYRIVGPHKKAMFIPDIDKWSKWKTDIIKAIASVDYAFIDGTFYDGAEISNRNISEIPHPFIVESMELFKDLPLSEKKKIYFIHFNHTNPLLRPESREYKAVIKNGYHVAAFGQQFWL